jgi:hypothetical protein
MIDVQAIQVQAETRGEVDALYALCRPVASHGHQVGVSLRPGT